MTACSDIADVLIVGATLVIGFAPLEWLVGLLSELARGLSGLSGEEVRPLRALSFFTVVPL